MAARLHFLRVTLITIVLGVVYGIAQDLMTTHVCVEYFSKFHPEIVASTDPVILALVWGVVATWWAAAALGMILGLAAAAGPRPLAPAELIARQLAVLLVALWVATRFVGLIGSQIGGPLSDDFLHRSGLPAGKESRFWFAYWSHLAAYAGAIALGVLLSISVWRRRAVTP